MSDIKEPIPGSTRVTDISEESDGTAQTAQSGAEDYTTDVVDAEAARRLALSRFTPAQEKKLMRRIDWHLMPLCSIIFMFKQLDVQNVSSARANHDCRFR